jgi:DNA-binding transcriptional MerR regulator
MSRSGVRISELSQSSGVPVPTIKFYLREGLLHEGVRTSATQAQYDESHQARLRLIRALVGPGGCSIAAAHRVIEAIEHPPPSIHDLLGTALGLGPAPQRHSDHERIHQLMGEWGWPVDERTCPTHDELARALSAMDAAGFVLPEGALGVYKDHLEQLAEYELSTVPTGSVAETVRYVVLGTVLPEPLILALRRMAQQQASARRFGEAEHRLSGEAEHRFSAEAEH